MYFTRSYPNERMYESYSDLSPTAQSVLHKSKKSDREHWRKLFSNGGPQPNLYPFRGLMFSGQKARVHSSWTYLEVRCVLFHVGFNTAAQLKDPTPLGLQGCSESLEDRRRKIA